MMLLMLSNVGGACNFPLRPAKKRLPPLHISANLLQLKLNAHSNKEQN